MELRIEAWLSQERRRIEPARIVTDLLSPGAWTAAKWWRQYNPSPPGDVTSQGRWLSCSVSCYEVYSCPHATIPTSLPSTISWCKSSPLYSSRTTPQFFVKSNHSQKPQASLRNTRAITHTYTHFRCRVQRKLFMGTTATKEHATHHYNGHNGNSSQTSDPKNRGNLRELRYPTCIYIFYQDSFRDHTRSPSCDSRLHFNANNWSWERDVYACSKIAAFRSSKLQFAGLHSKSTCTVVMGWYKIRDCNRFLYKFFGTKEENSAGCLRFMHTTGNYLLCVTALEYVHESSFSGF